MSEQTKSRREWFRKEIQPAALDVAEKMSSDHLEMMLDRASLFSTDDKVVSLTIISTMVPATIYACAAYAAQLVEAFISAEHLEDARKENERVFINMVRRGLSAGIDTHRENNP